MIELVRDFAHIPSREHRKALCALARVIRGAEEAAVGGGGVPGTVKGGRG